MLGFPRRHVNKDFDINCRKALYLRGALGGGGEVAKTVKPQNRTKCAKTRETVSKIVENRNRNVCEAF